MDVRSNAPILLGGQYESPQQFTVALADGLGLKGGSPSENKSAGSKRHSLGVEQQQLSHSITINQFSAVTEWDQLNAASLLSIVLLGDSVPFCQTDTVDQTGLEKRLATIKMG